ncbi:NAD-dependent epimerase/dehydratase family protein [Helicobacter trogontum]|uniref:NAD-dependent epimerase/dehydratase family protein n=1 Tax=Helicobacter trogontum TaxID=50960 RepID=A0A4U8TGF8_9HELI|nr:NAD-dependent epimerase/dehydratase family protein [Helicobacter trogontum]TLD98528.1 NAD-dependent epimerase/dehydratase family protein [Helicobacter trogontum]
MLNILITGGAGFIGSQLGFALSKKGYKVILVDDMSYGRLDNLVINGECFGEFIGMDIRSKELMRVMKGVDYVFHFAGIAPLPDCQTNPYRAIDINVAGSANVLEAARFNGVKKVIFSSTSAIYENNEKFPVKESHETAPYLIYSTSKKQAEMLCYSFFKTYGLHIAILRFFNVYGPHQDMKRKQPPLIGYIIKTLLMGGQQPVLHSDGSQKRDYVYIDDVVSLCEIVMNDENIKYEIFNVASGNAYSVIEIYNTIARHLQTNIQPIFRDATLFWEKYPDLYAGALKLHDSILEKEVNKYALGNNDKAKRLGWRPSVDINRGLFNCIEYAKNILGVMP